MEANIRLITRYLSPIGTRAKPFLLSLRSRMDRLPLFSVLLAWKLHMLELSLIVGAYFVYLLTRGLMFSDLIGTGLANAGRLVSVEQSAGFFWEPVWQSWILNHAEWLAVVLNWTYIFTYWPIILAAGLTLYVVNRSRYYYYRSVVMINLVFALLIFMLFPVTSPFNLTPYFVNTIQELGPSHYGSPEMAPFYNANAAMPSLHFSWTVILGVLFVRSFNGWFKLIGIVYPITTFFAITITGNHFILDAAAGGALALAAFAVMELGFRGGLFRVQRRLALVRVGSRRKVAQYGEAWPWVRERLLTVFRRRTYTRHRTAAR